MLPGCNSIGIPAPPPPVAPLAPSQGFRYSSYQAFGDSNTAGYGLANLDDRYASLTAVFNSLPLEDRARNGDMACDLPTWQIFANAVSPRLTDRAFFTVLIGTNDVDFRGPGAYEATYTLCHRAALSWLLTPLEDKLLATAATATGPSHLETQNGFNAITTDAPGSTVAFTFVRPRASALYLWFRISDGNPGHFACALDGTSMGVVASAAETTILTHNSTAGSVALLRVPLVAAGAHTLACSQLDGSQSGMGLIGIGWPSAPGTAGVPRLLAGLLPKQLNGAHSAEIAIYNQDIRDTVALLASDGLHVSLFDSAANMTGTAVDMYDALHPNPLGHQEVFRALQAALP